MCFLKILKEIIAQRNKFIFVFFGFVIFSGVIDRNNAYAVYDVPNNDAGCPANCRQVPWDAGSDQWNGGSLPNYSEATCSGLAEGNGTTNNSSAIQTCLNNASANTAVKIPAGIYYVNGQITIPSGKVLRGAGGGLGSQGTWLSGSYPGDTGAGAKVTTLKLGSSGGIFAGATSSGNFGASKSITGGYTKGSFSLTMAAGHGFVVNDWISVFENNDPAIVNVTGDIGTCTWCGNNNGDQTIQQFVQVTAVNGNTITISRPLYYTYQSGLSPSAKKISWGAQKSGVENLKMNGVSDHGKFIWLEQCLFCWVKGVETYNAGTAAKANHVYIAWSHGIEVRDSFLHFGRDSSSDRNYGVSFFFWNSDHKVENNILRHHRHSISFEGGGSGVAILYNYIDDDYTDDPSYLGSARINHGAHPMMNLFEGNWISHLTADSYWGSSSHITLFRNWLRGAGSNIGLPSNPNWGFIAVDIWKDQKYYNVVGNVLGVPTWVLGGLRNSGNCNVSSPTAYSYGCDSNGGFSAATFNSILTHGNYDYISKGIAFWDGGSDHTLKNSMYYSSKPAFFGNSAWPPYGPDGNLLNLLLPLTGNIPAKDRFEGVVVNIPAPPTNLRIVP